MNVSHALLALLSEGSKNGNQLRRHFEVSTGQIWTLNSGQVYATRDRLVRRVWVRREGTVAAGLRRYFEITRQGQEELSAWFRTPADTSTPPRDELVIKILLAISVPGVDALEVIQTHRKHLVRRREVWARIDGDKGDLTTALVAQAESYRVGALIHWLDTAEHAIGRASDRPQDVPH